MKLYLGDDLDANVLISFLHQETAKLVDTTPPAGKQHEHKH